MMPPKDHEDFDLELQLREALRRVEPEKDFSKVSYGRSRVAWWPPSRRVLALAAAVILMLLLPVEVIQYQARQQRREEARANLVKALRITESKLQKARQMVVRRLDRRNVI
jgi:hypothetical protein